MYRGILLLGFLALVVDAQVAQTDPIVNFCRRIWHSCKCLRRILVALLVIDLRSGY